MNAIGHLLVANPTDGTTQKKGYLKDLNWKLWIQMVWEEEITEWNTQRLNLPDIQEALRDAGIPFTRGDMKTNQALGAWGLDCIFTEAMVRLGIASAANAFLGVGNSTFGTVEVANPSDEFLKLNNEGKGNLFEAYASVLMMGKDIAAVRQLLFQILLTDTKTEKIFKAAPQVLRDPNAPIIRRANPPTIPRRDPWADDIDHERWSSDTVAGDGGKGKPHTPDRRKKGAKLFLQHNRSSREAIQVIRDEAANYGWHSAPRSSNWTEPHQYSHSRNWGQEDWTYGTKQSHTSGTEEESQWKERGWKAPRDYPTRGESSGAASCTDIGLPPTHPRYRDYREGRPPNPEPSNRKGPENPYAAQRETEEEQRTGERRDTEEASHKTAPPPEGRENRNPWNLPRHDTDTQADQQPDGDGKEPPTHRYRRGKGT